MSDSDTRLIQLGLSGLGFDPGPADGLYGPRTRLAGERWLAAGGRPAVTTAATPVPSRILRQGKAGYPVRELVLHCSATRPGWMAGETLRAQLAEIRRWHVEENGWRDIGYHWLIGRDGSVLPGRPETEIGAGVEGHNRGVIHICLIGGHGAASSDRFSDHFTAAQRVSAQQLIDGVNMRTRIERVSGHNEWAGKACPGFHVPTWIKEAA